MHHFSVNCIDRVRVFCIARAEASPSTLLASEYVREIGRNGVVILTICSAV
jgi:hypothetical protein